MTIEAAQLFIPQPGSRLGKYRLLSLLGRGGMGVVYEAEDTLLRRHVAVKVLSDLAAAESQAERRFLQEAQIAARLNHPHVVAIYEVDRCRGVDYIVMELMRGGSAQDFLTQRGAFHWLEATRIVADACRGLAAAHAAGLIHRDIKPANLMRSGDGLVKLADFGLAKASHQLGLSLSAARGLLGTPNYMSPEQCRFDPVDDRSDVYSLGATYYALLTGRPPFRGDLPLQVMFAHCSNPVPDPRTLDPTLNDGCVAIAMRAMAKAPAERYVSVLEMLSALEALLSTVAAPESATSSEWSQFARTADARRTRQAGSATTPGFSRSKGRWIAAAAVAASLLTGGYLWRPPVERAKPVSDASSTTQPVAPPLADPAVQINSPADLAAPIGKNSLTRGAVPETGIVVPLDMRIVAVAFSPDGHWLAAGGAAGDSGIMVWDLMTGKLALDRRLSRFDRSSGDPPESCAVRSLAFSADSKLLAASAQDHDGQRVMLWPLPSGPAPSTRLDAGGKRVGGVSFSDSGQLAAASDAADGATIRIWRPETGDLIATIRDRAPQIDSLAFRPGTGQRSTGERLAAGSSDGIVRIWNVATGQPEASLAVQLPEPRLSFSHDGKYLAVAGRRYVQTWDVETATRLQLWQVPSGEAVAAAFSADDRLLATASGTEIGGIVTLWAFPAGKQRAVFRGHRAQVRAVAIDSKRGLLASGSDDQTLRLWDISRFLDEASHAP